MQVLRRLRSGWAAGIFALTVLGLAGALGVGPMAVAAAQAQEPEGELEDPAESRSAAFQAVEGPQTEDVPGGTLLIGAYGIVLAALVLYVMRLGRMQARTLGDVERLERSLAAAEGGPDEKD